jgi:replicative DNA helicase Mcm
MIGAFMGDGFVDSNDIGYISTSKGLIEDYQDLLLKLGIYSRIIHDEQNSSYKLCIERDSFITFRHYILKGNCEKVRRANRVIAECEKILEKNDPTSHRRDSLKVPPNIRLISVRNVRKVENKGNVRTEWVYDVTVEPHHNFISHGLILHNTVSIAKGGIVATLNARTTIIAAANPKEGRYNRNRPPKDNIDLPVTLLSRFDLIFIIKDEPEVERDTKLVDHVLKTRQVRASYPEALPMDFIRKYIAYAKRIDVTMTEEAMKKIKDYYLKMRMRSSEEDPVSISPRQLESLIRLSEAIARAKLKTRVEAEDAERATFLLQRFLSDVGIDIETGKIDIDMIYSGIPMKKRSKAAVVIDAIERMIRRYPDGEYAYRREVIDYIINHTNLSASDAESIIDKLVSEGVLFEPGEGRIAKVSR